LPGILNQAPRNQRQNLNRIPSW